MVLPPRPTLVRAVGGATGHRLERRRVGNVTVVCIEGELSEQFPGLEVGRSLRGDVIIDLAGLDRITSFGVREWLTMLRELYASRLVFTRCSESFVNQVSMIRSFCSPGQIASFYAPYACSGCGAQFSALYDAKRDAMAIARRQPMAVACPRCGHGSSFDDDPSVYLAIDEHLVDELDPQLCAAIDQLDVGASSPIRKTVVGTETWVTVRARIDKELRLARAFDGLEGAILLDLSAVPSATMEGLDRLLHYLMRLERQVQSVKLVGCPFPMLQLVLRMADMGQTDPRLSVASVLVLAQSDRPSCQRMVLVDLQSSANTAAIRLGASPQVPNDWCRGTLDMSESLPILQRALEVFSQGVPRMGDTMVPDLHGASSMVMPSSSTSISAPNPRPRPRADDAGLLNRAVSLYEFQRMWFGSGSGSGEGQPAGSGEGQPTSGKGRPTPAKASRPD